MRPGAEKSSAIGRAFSPRVLVRIAPGALPQAGIERAVGARLGCAKYLVARRSVGLWCEALGCEAKCWLVVRSVGLWGEVYCRDNFRPLAADFTLDSAELELIAAGRCLRLLTGGGVV
jgi:hypothetical protein